MHNLDIKRAAFCGGNSPHTYAKAFGAHLFLSSEYADCKMALKNGVAAARIIPAGVPKTLESQWICLVFENLFCSWLGPSWSAPGP